MNIKAGVYTAAKPVRALYFEEAGALPLKNPHCKMSAPQKTWWECIDADETFIRKGFSVPGQYSSVKAKRDSPQSKELPTSWAARQERGRNKFKSLYHDSEQAAPPKAHATGLALGLSIIPEQASFNLFFWRIFWEAFSLCWCRTEKSLKSRKSLGMGSLFLFQLLISASLSIRLWFNKNWRFQRESMQRTSLLNPPLHNSLENFDQCQYPN